MKTFKHDDPSNLIGRLFYNGNLLYRITEPRERCLVRHLCPYENSCPSGGYRMHAMAKYTHPEHHGDDMWFKGATDCFGPDKFKEVYEEVY